MKFLVCILFLVLTACNSDKVELAFGTVLNNQEYVLEANLDVLALAGEDSLEPESMQTKLKVFSTLTQLEVYDDGSARYEMQVDSVDYSSNKRSVEELAYMEKLWESYELTLGTAEKYLVELSSMSEATKRISELKSEKKKLGDVNINSIEEYEQVYPPDVAAIHLLLKNLDSEWHNDDERILKIKEEQVKIQKEKAENSAW